MWHRAAVLKWPTMTPTLAELNAAAAREQARGDYLALKLAQAGWDGFNHSPQSIVERLRPHRAKALVPEIGTSSGLTDQGPAAYAELVRRVSLLGRIPGTRPAPMYAKLNSVDEEPIVGFVGAGRPIPAARVSFANQLQLVPAKVAGIVPLSLELVRHSDPAALPFIDRIVTRAVATGQDVALLDGAPAVEGERPASVLNGISATGGGSPADIEDDITALVKGVRSGEAAAPVFITSRSGALYLATLRDGGGARVFPDVTLNGGTLLGVPLLVSPAAAAKLIYLDGSALFYNDSGGVVIDSARDVTLQMTDTPTDGAQNLVSLYQTGATAVRFVQVVTWQLAAADAIGFIDLPLGSPVV